MLHANLYELYLRGASTDPLGEAAHIHANSPAGPRGDPDLSDEYISSRENGIWVCCNCHTIFDHPAFRHKYPPSLLREIKKSAIERATQRVINQKGLQDGLNESEYLGAVEFYNNANKGAHGLTDGMSPSFATGTYGFAGGIPHEDPVLCAAIHCLANPINLPVFRNRQLNELSQEITSLFKAAHNRITTGDDIDKDTGTQYVTERQKIIKGIASRLGEYSLIIGHPKKRPLDAAL